MVHVYVVLVLVFVVFGVTVFVVIIFLVVVVVFGIAVHFITLQINSNSLWERCPPAEEAGKCSGQKFRRG